MASLPNANKLQQGRNGIHQTPRHCIILCEENWYCVWRCVMILTCCLSHSVSSQKLEMDELGPGRAVYYTWAEPTGSRVLRWSWGPYSGELKNEQVRIQRSQHLNLDLLTRGNKVQKIFSILMGKKKNYSLIKSGDSKSKLCLSNRWKVFAHNVLKCANIK